MMLALCGCTSPPPPILGLDGRNCTPMPDFSNTLALKLAAGNAVTVDLGPNAACWQEASGGKSAYVVFALPDSLEPYLVTVTSPVVGQALFAPRIFMLDGMGSTLRQMPRDSFSFHGVSLYLGIRVYSGEKYIMIASDPTVVGRQESQLQTGTQATTTYSNGVAFSIHNGYENNQSFTYAVSGRVVVSAEPMPRAN